MAIIKIGVSDATNFFNLNGLDYQKGLWEIYYDTKNLLNGVLDKDNIRVGLRNKDKKNESLQAPLIHSDWLNGSGVRYPDLDTLIADLVGLINTGAGSSSNVTVDLVTNDIGRDAWGRPKVILDNSIFHGMFTYNVPVTTWREEFNGLKRTFVNATSENGKLVLEAGSSLNDETFLRTFRNPRYEPNRGHLYSTALFLPNVPAIGIRRWGFFTKESGAFFSLENGLLYGSIRTTLDGVITDDKYLIDTTGIDLSKGNTYDIQMQWRGVGNYKFFINLLEVKSVEYLGTRTELTTFNPANPLCFECVNLGDNVFLEVGCVDVTSEGGKDNGKTYGSISIDNESGQVAISGYNVPIIAVRSKATVDGLINTRDTLALLASAYADNKAFLRVWATRDFTAITENDQDWVDYGDGHLEYIQYDNPDVVTPMEFDTTKATLIFGCRVGQDDTYSTSALFEGRSDIYLTPEDMFVFTMHRENGGALLSGVTFEFGEEI